jgi:GNAT superfamily N-acetyltransferase
VAANFTFRSATADDAERLARGMVDGVEDYRSFAGAGWRAPSLERETAHQRSILGDQRVWCRIAEAGDVLAGQITVLPAAIAARPTGDAQLGHLSNLFVHPDHWGTGLATVLHEAAIAAARERGFTQLRLFVAAGQGRARHFYEREGWLAASEEFYDAVPDLVLVEYRYVL